MPASTGKVFVSAMQAVRPENAVFDLPIFGFHGSADKLTSPEGSQFIFASARNPASEFSLLPGLRHETLNEDGAMTRLQSVVTWLEAQMA
jgi:alpha-beta hydrolase superfamily lysophospholipase